jgi:phenylacetic acid degradation protein
LTDLVEAQPLRQASPERLSQRSQSEAVAVRLSGATAQLREERAAQTEIAKE